MPTTGSSRIGSFVLYVVLVACSIVFLLPLYLALVNSLENWYAVPTILPEVFKWDNYKFATQMLDFWHYFGNSLILCGISVFTSTFVSGLVGYAFARLQAPGRSALFMIVLSTMMLPGIVTQIPQYILFYKFGLINTYLPWIIGGLGGNAFFIFLYRQFFATIPKELEEAARIDGCSIFRTYWNMFIPLSLPVVATVSIFNFQGTWSDFITPFFFLKQVKYPLATALTTINYTEGGSTQIIQQVSVAAGVIFMIPILITFFIGQRFIVDGIVTTGVKG
ncbi:carbohydrate ABC transporter permease [Paenibacillus albus]|uniref:Carbohydrate ABC transporter permease n=1 Tax=Paenibacillus albus TaxID=2495582 RepID=A0A3Q8X433_9BACL|nr:carbohydrate ABC transporter permease [Paenibacillus albus]AZN39309.1 carbohydrate ABC transporter permease [Paenibacillus albus]